jgi:outer membrane protein TolC
MKKNTIYFFLLLLIIISEVSANAQDSLAFYLEQAALNNPGIKAKYLEYSAALEKVPQAGSLPDPELQFGYFLKPMELMSGYQVADIRFMQMFPWFGLLKNAKDEASQMALSKFESFRDSKAQLYFAVKSSYYKVYRTLKEIAIAKKNLDILHSLEQLALIKFSSGSSSSSTDNSSSNKSSINISPSGNQVRSGNNMQNQISIGTSQGSSEAGKPAMATQGSGMGGTMAGDGNLDMVNLLRVQIEINELENKIALLHDQVATDKVSFNRFLNRAPSYIVFTGDSLIEAPIPNDIMTRADSITNHPIVKMYRAESEASAAKLKMVTRMGYPMLGLGVNYSVIKKFPGVTSAMNGKDMIMPMLSLTLPIYRKKQKAMRNEAELMSESATALAENVTNDLQVNFQETIQNLNDADRRVKLFTSQAILADKSLQLLITSFSTGGTDFAEVLRMEQQLLDYQFKKVEAVVDKNTSIARLVYLTVNN